MGYISYDGGEKFAVKLESTEDRAALRAALKATPGTDEGEPTDSADTLHFDYDNPSNVLAFWAAEFDWESRAIRLALDQLAPLAWQHVSMHSGALRRLGRADKGMLAGLADLVKRKAESDGPR